MTDIIEDDDCDFVNVPAETPLSLEEAVIRRHRREKKELQGKIQAMKKNVSKSDKKKKKELADEITKLEAELEQRQKVELDTFKPNRLEIEVVPPPTIEESTTTGIGENESIPLDAPETPKLSKARRRREKKEAEEKERRKRVDAETEELTENGVRVQEEKQLAEILKNMKLEIVDIPSDGHCLYNAVSDQLERFGETWNVDHLRKQTAIHLRKHRNDFIHFLDEEFTSESGYDRYCTELESTAAWGGQVEAQVLSQVIARPIKVIQADGPSVTFGEEFKKPGLNLTFHRHKFQLGAHYNSAIPQHKN